MSTWNFRAEKTQVLTPMASVGGIARAPRP